MEDPKQSSWAGGLCSVGSVWNAGCQPTWGCSIVYLAAHVERWGDFTKKKIDFSLLLN